MNRNSMGFLDRRRARKLLKEGVAAEARIVDRGAPDLGGLGQLGRLPGRVEMSLPSLEERLVVEVQPEGGEAFRAEVAFEREGAFQAIPLSGGTIPVRYDPSDHTAVVDVDALSRRGEELLENVQDAQAVRERELLAGADPKAARLAEGQAMFQAAQQSGMVPGEFGSLMEQAQSMMQQAQTRSQQAQAFAAGMHLPTAPATATILALETEATAAGMSVVVLRVSFQLSGGEPVETTIRTAVPPDRVASLAPGATLQILYEPAHPSNAVALPTFGS